MRVYHDRVRELLGRTALVVAVLTTSACGADQSGVGSGTGGDGSDGGTDDTSSSASSTQRFPDVVEATVECGGEATCTAEATISSPYDSPERYADAFRVSTPQGEVLGVRELLHDHAGEQPFTRSLTGVRIPSGVDEVVVEGRDQANGWGGETVTVPVQR